MTRHHRRYASRGLANFEVDLAINPQSYAAEWGTLYQNLIIRHRISGLWALSAESLSRQLQVPGCLYFRALKNGVAHGALVCYLDRGVGYAHLIATTAEGQKLFAQYALYWAAIEYCRDRAGWFVLGSVPGGRNIPATIPGYLFSKQVGQRLFVRRISAGTFSIRVNMIVYAILWEPQGRFFPPIGTLSENVVLKLTSRATPQVAMIEQAPLWIN